jgi:SAM-dependent methyltransferase
MEEAIIAWSSLLAPTLLGNRMAFRHVVKSTLRRLTPWRATMGADRHALVGDPTLASMKRDFQITFLRNNGLLQQHRFLDLGCGTLRGGIPIIQHLVPGQYYGVDVRPTVIAEARRELHDHDLDHKQPTLVCLSEVPERFRNLCFDIVWAFSVLIHMHDADFRQTMRFVADHLCPGGRFFANVNIGNEESRSRWQGFPVVTRPLTFYERESAAVALKPAVLGSLERLGHRSGRPEQDQQIMLCFTKDSTS